MIRKFLASALVASGIMAGAGVAHAADIQSLSFSGTLQNGWDGSGLFGAANTSLTGDAYSITISYDASSFTQSYSSDSCGAASNSSCYFTFTAASAPTETVTINGKTQTFVGDAGGIGLNASAHDDIEVNVQGAGGLSFSDSFQDGTSFFPNQSDVNNPDLASFTNVTLAQLGTSNTSIGSTSFGANPATLSADPAASVPEPASLVLLGAGLFGLGLVRARRG